MLPVLDALNVCVLVQLMFLRWFLGMAVKLAKLLLHLELKIVLVANVVNLLAQRIS
jgi:hypothetical protein